MDEPPITLRAAGPEDEPFLAALYRDTRAEETAGWGWDAVQLGVFFDFQFRAARLHQRTHHPGAEDSIVSSGGRPIGRILVERSGAQIYVVDVALLRDNTGNGIGSLLMRRLQAEAVETRHALRLQVARSNRAVRFYEHLGFLPVEERGTHLLMQWLPAVP